MSCYKTVNILDMIEAVGNERVNQIISDFSCPKNNEVENFVKKNAVDFSKRKMSITQLILDDEGELIAIFTLTHKAVEIGCENLSAAARKRIERYAQINETTKSYMVSAFLIAQLGKNYANENNTKITGDSLMESAMSVLATVQHEIGGGIVYLECEDKLQLLSFYQNPRNAFRIFGDRFSKTDNVKYIQLLRFF